CLSRLGIDLAGSNRREEFFQHGIIGEAFDRDERVFRFHGRFRFAVLQADRVEGKRADLFRRNAGRTAAEEPTTAALLTAESTLLAADAAPGLWLAAAESALLAAEPAAKTTLLTTKATTTELGEMLRHTDHRRGELHGQRFVGRVLNEHISAKRILRNEFYL